MSTDTSSANPVSALVQAVLEKSRFFAKQGGPLSASFQEGHPDSRVLLIAGENASGKSLLVQLLAGRLNDAKIEPLQVSMRYRTAPGMHRVFMFGVGDSEDSTGNVSLSAINGGLRTAEGRESANWLMLDEPDVGLTDGYCGAMGTYLATFGNRLPVNACEGLVVVTHSRRLVSSMLFGLQKTPHFLCFSQSSQESDALQAWLEDDRERTVDELLALSSNSKKLHREVDRILDESRRAAA